MLLNKKRFGVMLLLISAMLIVLAGCGANSTGNNKTDNSQGATEDEGPKLLGKDKHPVVTIELSNDKTIKLELYPEVAPNSVNNFISLINKGFYDGVIFHRVIPGFMIQGGDPDGVGTGGPGYSIPGEFSSNGFENKLKHTRGVLSMARSSDPDSAGSQFFIMVADAPSLDKNYASFGMVTEGMDAVDEIVNQKRDSSDKPETPILMKKVTVDTLGMTFEEPKKTE